MKERIFKTIGKLALLVFAGLSISLSAKTVERANILLILADDMGFSDIGCYGGEIPTPNIDKLAKNGIRFTQFYNGARCCPSRASLLTGLYPHQAHVGDMVDEYARRARELLDSPAYGDHLNPHTPTIAEALRGAGYRTFMSGKWHLGYRTNEWPYARGFDRSFAVIEGAMNYYGFGMQHTGIITNPPMAMDDKVFLPPREGFFSTDAFTDFAVKCLKEQPKSQPFFLYLAYNAPHWPLQAHEKTIARFRGKYKKLGWDKVREQRMERLKKSGIIKSDWELSPRAPRIPSWDDAAPEQKEQWDEEMAVYAAQVSELDTAIGRVLKTLKQTGRDKNTLVIFLSDNGAAAEDPNRSLPGAKLGTRESYEGYRLEGANVSCTPFRKTKKYTHEGGISTPFIVSWPGGIAKPQRGKLNREIGTILDLMPTFLDVANAKFPKENSGGKTTSLEGIDLVPAFTGKKLSRPNPIFWEHEGHRAVRDGKWKLVASHDEPWELYDMETDRTELNDLSKAKPGITRELIAKYEAWAKRVDAKPWPFPAKRPEVPRKD